MRTPALNVFTTLLPLVLGVAVLLTGCAVGTATDEDGAEVVNSAATATPRRPGANANDPVGSADSNAAAGASANGSVTPLKTTPAAPQPQPWYPAPLSTVIAGSGGSSSGSPVEPGH